MARWDQKDYDEAKRIIEAETGRDITPQEWAWLTQTRGGETGGDIDPLTGKPKGVTPQDDARGLADKLRRFTGSVQAEAQSLGINLSEADAKNIRNSLYVTGDPESEANFMSRVRGRIGSLAQEQTQNKLLDQLGLGGGGAGGRTQSGSGRSWEENWQEARRLLSEAYGRDPRKEEIDFFAGRLNDGESPYEVSSFLRTTPEYMELRSRQENERVAQESSAARQALDAELQKSQQEVFNRASADIISQFQRAGRIGSSGVANAIAKAQADLDRERQSFLANAAYNDSIRAQGYRREDFVGSNARAFDQYLRQNEPRYQQQFNLQNIGNQLRFQLPLDQLQRQYSLADQRTARAQELEDYYRQKSDYNDYFQQQRQDNRQAALYGLLGNMLGSGMQAGAMYYGLKR